jgi:hypothetical protein
MGSKQALSNGNEPQEVAELLKAFERANQVTIDLQFTLEDHHGVRVMLATGAAYNNHADPVVRARWVLVTTVLWAQAYTSLMGLVTTLLYRLDFEICEAEMRSIGNVKA